MTIENLERKVLYLMLAKITGRVTEASEPEEVKRGTYAVRMFFFRNRWDVLNHNDFIKYVERFRA